MLLVYRQIQCKLGHRSNVPMVCLPSILLLDGGGRVIDLVNKIELFVEHYNANAAPFMWTATAESILAKLQRLCAYISGTRH